MTSPDPADDIVAIAARLMNERGLRPPTQVKPLVGGRNNRTYVVESPAGRWLLKQYFPSTDGGRDRCGSEWDWLTFCWQRGVRCVPEPLARAADQHASLMEFIDGRKLKPTETDASHVDQAAVFVTQVNQWRQHPAASNVPQAAESCFSLAQHIACIQRRVERLSMLPVIDDLDAELQAWLKTSLMPAWRSISAQSRRETSTDEWTRELRMEEHCLSPSDFGFHNALLTPAGSLRFLDFEYAGWDDPAKLICDFYCQQDLPAPRATKSRMLSALSECDSRLDLERRVETLTPVYGIKWCCLVLNEFVAADQRRREFAQLVPVTIDRRTEQLARAKRLLAEVMSGHQEAKID